MRIVPILPLTVLFLSISQETTLPPRGTIEDRDQKTVRSLLSKYQEAREKANTRDETRAWDELGELLKKIASDKGIGGALRCLEDWPDILKGLETFKRPSSTILRVQEVDDETWERTPIRVRYALSVPRGYDPSKSYPLLFCLPPKDVEKESDLKKFLGETWVKTPAADSMILVAPSSREEERTRRGSKPGPVHNWGVDTLYAFFFPMRDVREKFNVDENRVFLDGFGEAGAGAFELGSLYADLFAGVIVRSALPTERTMLANFRNLPVLYLVGEKDGVAEAQAKEVESRIREGKGEVTLRTVPGRWEESFAGEAEAVLKWIEGRRRNPFPEEIVWETWDLRFTRAYWLRILEMETSLDPAKALRQRIRIRARAVRAPAGAADRLDTIEIEGKDVIKVQLSLNDRLVNLDRTFSVVVNQQVAFTGTKERSLEHLLRESRQSRDPSRVFVNFVEVSFPGNAASK